MARESKLSGIARRRVVIIDDDIDLHSFLGMVLEGDGYLVFSALDAANGLELVFQIEPDLVILDAAIPGAEALRVAQAIAAPPGAPGVVLLADVEPNDADMRLAHVAGISDIVLKPFDVEDMLARLARVVGGRRDVPLM